MDREKQLDLILVRFDAEGLGDLINLDPSVLRKRARELLKEAEELYYQAVKESGRRDIGPPEVAEEIPVNSNRLGWSSLWLVASYDGLYYRLSACLQRVTGLDLED